MATVGYGDAKPVTTCWFPLILALESFFESKFGHEKKYRVLLWIAGGKLVATATSICGIIVLAFPISMIVEKFASAQQRSIQEMQMQQGNFPPSSIHHLASLFSAAKSLLRVTYDLLLVTYDLLRVTYDLLRVTYHYPCFEIRLASRF